MTFSLDARLRNDTHLIGESQGALLLMMNDNRYPWFVMVPTRANVSEWFDLPEQEQIQHHLASVQLGCCIRSAFDCDKINIAALGNVVQQLHIHVIGRFNTDAAWPGPVWGHSAAIPFTETELTARKELLFTQRDLPFTPV